MMLQSNDLNICYFNCNSIISKKDDILDFLLEFDIDVAMFSETYLKHHHKFELQGYYVLRLDEDANRHGGGLAMAIKISIEFQQINIQSLRTLPYVLAVKLMSMDNEPINLVATYVPNSVLRVDKRDLAVIFRLGKKVVLAGDINAKHRAWGCQCNNARGDSINEFIIQQGNRIQLHYPTKPTYYPYDVTRHPSVIDLCLSKGVRVRHRPKSMPVTDSDHNPVILGVVMDSALRQFDCNHFQYSRANWPLFEAHLTDRIRRMPQVIDQNSLDNAIDELTNAITTGQTRSVPKWKDLPEELPNHITAMKRERNRMRRLSQLAATSPDVKRQLRTQVNQLSVMIKNAISHHRNTLLRRKMSRYRQYDNRIHFHVREILDEKQFIPPLTSDDQTFYSETAKANILAEKFESVFRQNDGLGDPQHIDEVETAVHDYLQQSFDGEIVPTTAEELKSLIAETKTRKAPGPDGVKNVLLKHLPMTVITWLVLIFNTMMRLSLYPKSWKNAFITPVLKPKKDPSNPFSYRPISLLSLISKLFERVIGKRLREELVDKGIIPTEQFGFMENCSTAHPDTIIKHEVSSALKEKKSTAMVLLDVEKAFDTVWISGLIYKMILIGISPYLIRLIHVYLSARSFIVKVGRSRSNQTPTCAGVPQGSVLGPILFLIYFYDIPRHEETKLSIFADDTSMRATDLSPRQATTWLQEHLLLFEEYFKRWKVKVNVAKSEMILFTRRRRFINDAPITLKLYNEPIKSLQQVKYLGLVFQSNLKFTQHCTQSLNKAKAIKKKLWKLLGPRSYLDNSSRVHLFRTYIRPNFTYNIQVWLDVAPTTFKKLQAFQNLTLRDCLSLRPDPITFRFFH